MEKASFRREFISADPAKCTGCSLCEYACALEKEKSFNPLRSRIRVVRLHPLVNVTMVCRFCEDAPCVPACPRDALYQSAESGVILVEEEKCDACGWCIQACPYGAIMLHPEKKVAITCDLCGGEPECINYCPEEALELITEEVVAHKAWISVVEKRSLEAQKLTEFIESAKGADIFIEAEEKQKRFEEKLESLRKKEIELYMTSE